MAREVPFKRAEAYAAKFKEVYGPGWKRVEPTDAKLQMAFAACVRPARPAEYDTIRRHLSAPDWECHGPRDCAGTLQACRHCAPGATRCPTGDGLHITYDEDGGPCDRCLEYIEQMRHDFWEDQAKAFPEHLR